MGIWWGYYRTFWDLIMNIRDHFSLVRRELRNNVLYPYSLFKWGTKELLRVSQAHDSYGLRGILWDILLEFLDIFYRESQKAHGLPTGCSCHWHFLATRPRKKGWLRPGNCNLRCENQGAKGLPWFGCRIPVEGGRLFHLLGGHGCGFGGREAAMWPLLSSQMS